MRGRRQDSAERKANLSQPCKEFQRLDDPYMLFGVRQEVGPIIL